MPRILSTHATELGVTALPQELHTTVERTKENLQTAAAQIALEAVGVADGALTTEVQVANQEAFIGWVLSFGTSAEVIAPDEMRLGVRARVEQALGRLTRRAPGP